MFRYMTVKDCGCISVTWHSAPSIQLAIPNTSWYYSLLIMQWYKQKQL